MATKRDAEADATSTSAPREGEMRALEVSHAPPGQVAVAGASAADRKQKRLRQYEVWPGNERFFCGGLLVTGPYWWSILGTTALILIPSGVFVGLVAYPLYDEYGLGIAFLCVSAAFPALVTGFLFCTGCINPGIIPRNPAPSNAASAAALPRTREVEVNGHTVVVRYNETCHFYQPPRAHHCSVIDDCIERFDHYCPWVGTTVGRRNYRFFLLFVFSCSLLCIYVFAFCAYLIKRKSEGAGTKWEEAIRKEAAAIILMIFVFIGFWFVGGLSMFHVYLLSRNQTTYENIRYSYDRNYVNPYNRGCLWNWAEVFCTAMPPSNVNFRGFVDDAGSNHGVGGGREGSEGGDIALEVPSSFSGNGAHGAASHDAGQPKEDV